MHCAPKLVSIPNIFSASKSAFKLVVKPKVEWETIEPKIQQIESVIITENSENSPIISDKKVSSKVDLLNQEWLTDWLPVNLLHEAYSKSPIDSTPDDISQEKSKKVTEELDSTPTEDESETLTRICISLPTELSIKSGKGRATDERKFISWTHKVPSRTKGNFSTRCDVVYKTIFRYLRKFYIDIYHRFLKSKCSNVEKSQHLKLFCQGISKTPGMENLSLPTLMIAIGSIIYPSKMVQLKKKISTDGKSDPVAEAKQKVFDSIIKFRELITKFSLRKLVNLIKDETYSCIFEFYHLALKSGKVEIPDTMKSNFEVYSNAFEMLRSHFVLSNN